LEEAGESLKLLQDEYLGSIKDKSADEIQQ
jgi:hypothetical protein